MRDRSGRPALRLSHTSTVIAHAVCTHLILLTVLKDCIVAELVAHLVVHKIADCHLGLQALHNLELPMDLCQC